MVGHNIILLGVQYLNVSPLDRTANTIRLNSQAGLTLMTEMSEVIIPPDTEYIISDPRFPNRVVELCKEIRAGGKEPVIVLYPHCLKGSTKNDK